MASTRLDVLPGDVSLASFSLYCQLRKRSKEREYNYFLEGYIHGVCFSRIEDNDEIDMCCKCNKSMRKSDSPHVLTVTLSQDCKIINSQCSCVAGMSGSCSHIVGLIHTVSHYQQSGLSEVPAEESATSLPQQSHKPRGKRIHPQAVSSMVMAKPRNVSKRKRRPILATAPSQKISPPTKQQLDSLKLAKGTPLSYLVTSFPHNHGIQYAYEDISLSNTFCPITLDEPNKLEQETTRQASCDKWFSARSDRITASNFSKVFKRKKRY